MNEFLLFLAVVFMTVLLGASYHAALDMYGADDE